MLPASCRSMTRFRASCTTHPAVGCAVAPRIRTRRVACSMTANTNSRAPARVRVSKKSQASSASAWPRRKSAQVVACRCGAAQRHTRVGSPTRSRRRP